MIHWSHLNLHAEIFEPWQNLQNSNLTECYCIWLAVQIKRHTQLPYFVSFYLDCKPNAKVMTIITIVIIMIITGDHDSDWYCLIEGVKRTHIIKIKYIHFAHKMLSLACMSNYKAMFMIMYRPFVQDCTILFVSWKQDCGNSPNFSEKLNSLELKCKKK